MRTHAHTHTHRCTQNPRSVTRARSFSEFDILSRISYQRTNWEMHCKSNCGRICIGHIWNNNQSVYRLLLRTFTLTTLQTRPTNAHTTLFPTQSCCSWLFFPQTRWCSETNRSFCGFQRSHECPIGLSPEKKIHCPISLSVYVWWRAEGFNWVEYVQDMNAGCSDLQLISQRKPCWDWSNTKADQKLCDHYNLHSVWMWLHCFLFSVCLGS